MAEIGERQKILRRRHGSYLPDSSRLDRRFRRQHSIVHHLRTSSRMPENGIAEQVEA
jgi:hypothetical protein